MKPRLYLIEPDGARRLASDGHFWSELTASLLTIATRCAERGYAADKLILTGSGGRATETWKVELLMGTEERSAARKQKAALREPPPAPQRHVESHPNHLHPKCVRDFCTLTGRRETSEGLRESREALGMALSTAQFSRQQDNGLELWRARGRGAAHGTPRWRFLVKGGRLVRVLSEHDRRPAKRVRS